jgi:hypothetical protein
MIMSNHQIGIQFRIEIMCRYCILYFIWLLCIQLTANCGICHDLLLCNCKSTSKHFRKCYTNTTNAVDLPKFRKIEQLFSCSK